MPGDLNRAFLIGELIEAPAAEDGKVVLMLRTTDRWKDKAGEPRSRSVDHRLLVLNPSLLAYAARMRKGDRICAEGANHGATVVLGSGHSSLQLLNRASDGGFPDEVA